MCVCVCVCVCVRVHACTFKCVTERFQSSIFRTVLFLPAGKRLIPATALSISSQLVSNGYRCRKGGGGGGWGWGGGVETMFV